MRFLFPWWKYLYSTLIICGSVTKFRSEEHPHHHDSWFIQMMIVHFGLLGLCILWRWCVNLWMVRLGLFIFLFIYFQSTIPHPHPGLDPRNPKPRRPIRANQTKPSFPLVYTSRAHDEGSKTLYWLETIKTITDHHHKRWGWWMLRTHH